MLMVLQARGVTIGAVTITVSLGMLMAATVLYWREPLPFAAIVATVLFADHIITNAKYTLSERSFFTVHRIYESSDGRFRVLRNGTTVHGAECIRDSNGAPVAGRPAIISYYYDGSAIAQVIDATRAREKGPIRYAVIGLGAGTLACRAEPSDTVHFYEIDPSIIRIARDPALFTFLSECRPDVPIVLGDARLTLADAPDESYDIILADAFSSDAIPIHLMTREAMALYLKKLRPHGIVVMHISNRHLELASVVAGVATANGLVTRVNAAEDGDNSQFLYGATIAAVARDDLDFGSLAQSKNWEVQAPDPLQRVWTDDYCNIIGAVLRKRR
jgi:hypothetical protein